MPVVRDVPVSISMQQLLRRGEIGSRRETLMLLRELLLSVKNLHLLEPTVGYEVYSVTEVHHDRLCLEGNVVLHGPLLPSLLSSAKELAVVVCTIGPRLEEKVADYFAQNAPLRSLLLDNIGSAAVDFLAQKACQFVRHEVSSRGYEVSSPVSPGMVGLAISEQWKLFQLVPAEQIGVRLTSSGVMVPRKSISMVMGIGLKMPTWTQTEVCERCSLAKTCRYRVCT